MECWNSHRVSDYLNGRGTPEESRAAARHLDECPVCADRADDRLHHSLRSLPVRVPSSQLTSKLRVLASREALRRREGVHPWRRIKTWYHKASFNMNAMMKPLAVPVAGGILSAILLFAMLTKDFAYEVHPVHNDIETSVYTQATIKDIGSIGVSDTDITVELTVDENGRMLEYRVIGGEHLLRDESLRRRLVNNLMYGQFYPATQFGQPVAGKLRVSFRSSTIDIKG